MLESLRIENIAIVERAELEFSSGLNVLTGETGAGKSIVLGALALLMGSRVPAGSLRETAEQGRVEALFRSGALPDLEEELAARGLAAVADGHESPDLHELVVSRSLVRDGRSRARIGGQLVPVSTLAELFSGRVEISSQHSSQRLLRPESHGRMLDAAGGLEALRDELRRHYENVRRLDAELLDLQTRSEERMRQQDYLAYQLSEIDDVDLQPGEIEQVERDHARLSHAEQLQEQAGAALLALADVDGGDANSSATDRLGAARRALEGLLRFDGELEELVTRLRGLEAELRDVSLDLERYLDAVEADSAQLSVIEERLAKIEGLRRKYGREESEIRVSRSRIASELESIEGADSRAETLRETRACEAEQLDQCARRLSAGRAEAARALTRQVEKSLRALGMREARFVVELPEIAHRAALPEGVSSGPSGAEAPEFRFSANRGSEPQPLQKVASGGELSRVFLALKNALRGSGHAMVLVFDEVDAGVGGREAERIGRVLADLASRHQVLCITHHPQIAALAQTHFRVRKGRRDGRARARVDCLCEDERVEEIARMAGGAAVSEITRQHARDLLRAGRSSRPGA